MTSAPPFLEAKAICHRRKERTILSDVNLVLRPGELVALVGPNGSGKSTLMRLLAGSLAVGTGSILIHGGNTTDMPPSERARHVAYLPQDFHSHWDLTVRELLAIGRRRGQSAFPPLHPAPAPETATLAETFHLSTLLDRRLDSLSGGEQARAACAACLGTRASILLADEPTANLDIGNQLTLMRWFRTRCADAACLVVLHDLNLASRFADRIVVLDQGRVALDGKTSAILASPDLNPIFAADFLRMEVPWRTAVLPA